MAGPLIKTNTIHPQNPQNNPSGFRSRNLVEASVTIMGRVYRTNIRAGATAENLIEKIAKENDGWVSKKFYPQFNTYEIIAVKIGDQLLVKSTGAGIHFSLGPAGIPMAVTAKQGIVFPNAEELRIGKATSNIELWTTGSNLDFADLGDLSKQYSKSGGIRLSEDALKKVSAAHGGSRNEKLLMEENILVLNKDTGEILTAAQNAHALELFPSIQSESIFQISNPAVYPMNDGSIFQMQYLMVRPFDGKFMDLVRVQYEPLPFDGIATEKIAIVPMVPDLMAPMGSGSAIRKGQEPKAPSFVPIRFAQVELPIDNLSKAQKQPDCPKFHRKPVAMDAIRAWMKPRSEPLMIQTRPARVQTQKNRVPPKPIESDEPVRSMDMGNMLEKSDIPRHETFSPVKMPANPSQHKISIQYKTPETCSPAESPRKKRKRPRMLANPALKIQESKASSKMKKQPKPKTNHHHPKAKPKHRNDHPDVKPPRGKIRNTGKPRNQKIPTDSAPKARQAKNRAAQPKNIMAKRDRAIKHVNPVRPEIKKTVKKNKTLDSKKMRTPAYFLNEMLGLHARKARKRRVSGRARAGN